MRILVTGGGTGGHIYPALAFIKYMKKKDETTEVLYVGGNKGLENSIVPKEGIPFETIEIQGFKRSLSMQNLKTVYLFLRSLKRARQILNDFKPDVVIGTGGYVSGSVLYVSSKRGIPTIVHEQNSVPGMTNTFLSKYVQVVATCFEEAAHYFPKAKRVERVGNPRAQEIAGLEKDHSLEDYGLQSGKKTVVIFGGSQGALKINEAFIEALPYFKEKPYQVLYASGKGYYEEYKETFEKAQKEMKNVAIRPYIQNMPEVLANAQLFAGRSGATTVAEVTATGIAGIFIPSPYVTNDHQTKNAQVLVESGAAKSILNKNLTGEKLAKTIDEILQNDAQLKKMQEESKKQGVPDACDRLLQLIQEIT